MKILILLLLVGCTTTPMTEREREEIEYFETERRAQYLIWVEQCNLSNGVVFIYNPIKSCYGNRECIPDKFDWSHERRINRVQCVNPKSLERALSL